MDVQQLIEEVRKFPVIYDQRSENYRNIEYKDRVWETIATDLQAKAFTNRNTDHRVRVTSRNNKDTDVPWSCVTSAGMDRSSAVTHPTLSPDMARTCVSRPTCRHLRAYGRRHYRRQL
ncbi:uncharacterized protein LOC124777904 [Schistocerca piceifrons]|uniref:uncharacterized protein LOC124777904 n=1 Tax=Schistocerca piceifrons TaxID=274613 RepID=UPI001F5EF0AA|nr:uncharacterized protein LOC124777904 [Schistocerca piceifrons]